MNLTSFASHCLFAGLAPQQAHARPSRLHGYPDDSQEPPSRCGRLAFLHGRLSPQTSR